MAHEPPRFIYIDPMPNVAPIINKRTTTSLNVDDVEWARFVAIMRRQGRSASDGVRELVRNRVRDESN